MCFPSENTGRPEANKVMQDEATAYFGQAKANALLHRILKNILEYFILSLKHPFCVFVR